MKVQHPQPPLAPTSSGRASKARRLDATTQPEVVADPEEGGDGFQKVGSGSGGTSTLRSRILSAYPQLQRPFREAQRRSRREAGRHGTRGDADAFRRAVAAGLRVRGALRSGFDFGDALDLALAFGVDDEGQVDVSDETALHFALVGGMEAGKLAKKRPDATEDDLVDAVSASVIRALRAELEIVKIRERLRSINLEGWRAAKKASATPASTESLLFPDD